MAPRAVFVGAPGAGTSTIGAGAPTTLTFQFGTVTGGTFGATGNALSLADFTAAAHFSCLDYISDVDWDRSDILRDWYATIKSRPAFRTLLNDRVVAMPPSRGYADLDF